MKKQLLPGVALGFTLFLSFAVWASPVRDTQPATRLQAPDESHLQAAVEAAAPSKRQPSGPERQINDATQALGARWSQIGQTAHTDLMGFTSTFAANNAAQLLSNNNNSLSFASFGRVPYYQMLTITNQLSTTSNKATPSSPSASLPEPASLTLLGAGLAALAVGLRKRKKKIDK